MRHKVLLIVADKYLSLWAALAVLLTTGCVALMVGAGAGVAGTVYVRKS